MMVSAIGCATSARPIGPGDALRANEEVGSWDKVTDVPIPAAIAANGHDLLVVSSKDMNTAVLREYRVDDGTLGAVIYANPSFDIVDATFGYEGSQLLAVVYEEEGIRRYHYLDPVDAAQQTALDRLFAGKSVTTFTWTPRAEGRSTSASPCAASIPR
jgi:hypothetical protein